MRTRRETKHCAKDKRKARPAAKPFRNNDEILESALDVLRTREDCANKMRRCGQTSVEYKDANTAQVGATRSWHERLAATPATVYFVGLCARLRLNRVEREVLAAALLHAIGLLPSRLDASDVIQLMVHGPAGALAAQKAMSEAGRLYRSRVLYFDGDLDLSERKLFVDPAVLGAAAPGRGLYACFAHITREEQLHDALAPVTRALLRTSDELRRVMRGYNAADFTNERCKRDMLLSQLDRLLDERPQWRLSKARRTFPPHGREWGMLLALAGRALLHLLGDRDLFTGGGLSRATCSSPDDYRAGLRQLLSDAPLLRDGFIQPCGGDAQLLSDSVEAVQEVQFELTDQGREMMGIGQAAEGARAREEGLREPCLRLSDLALPASTRNALQLALDHVRHASILLDAWGLRKVFPYGNGVTLLFCGPPGTGKTATAEALARELNMPLLVADYTKIQNCFVGQTEKNIAAVFRRARQHRALLFWDEADAMFFDRDAAHRTWEVRDVNVLLQEIERFEGVCVLATNRRASLDKALERRITVKLDFPRPDRELRHEIWRRLLPPGMPIAADVEIMQLAEADLSGGEIKNVILNAARAACGRGTGTTVTMDDFRGAVEHERCYKWSASPHARIGFIRPATPDDTRERHTA